MAEVDDLNLTEEERAELGESQGEAQAEPSVASEGQQENIPQQAQSQTQQQEQRMVPLAALQEAREQIKVFRQSDQQRNAVIEQLRNEIMAIRQGQQQAQQPKAPTFEEDFLGATQHEIRTLKEQGQIRDQILIEQIRQQEAARQTQEFASYVTQAESVFTQANPDYPDAYQFVVNTRINELKAVGITDPNMVLNALREDAFRLSNAAFQAGKSPAEAIYEIAHNYGYKKQTVPQGQQSQQEEISQRFQQINKGQQAAKTLQGAGGPAPSTVEALLAADDDDFDKMWNEFWKDKK